ncbi:hypothetical protein [Cognatiyoonia sp. IB215182]|uniref:hypothetical protein n=1 Tax=Cognatiyoonia sp. IB215182 TaxID=3097353 RepID=UPI002A138CE3|nr:hypothetical protein [Cognatiyoonia sp. IB215182]MDX8353661.1 hypothetical protein [Cognatiyoonia sp. IB215182]
MGVHVIIWGIIALGVGGYAASKAGDAAESTTELVKWATIAGGVYVSYRALQASGAIK